MHSVELFNGSSCMNVRMNRALFKHMHPCKCGNKKLTLNATHNVKDERYVSCDICKTKGPEGASPIEAIKLWNTYQLIS